MERNSRLSRFRTELMGIGALGVLLVHSLDIVPWPNRLISIVSYGGVGVYIFVFLSGVGLYHSFASRGGRVDRTEFYRRRFSRVLVPYLLISGIWYGMKYLIFQFQPGMFLLELSTLSFWLHHKGAWYVAMLIPLYLIYPFFHNWMQRSHRGLKTCILVILILGLGTVLHKWMPALLDHLSQVMNSLWIFALGYYYGKKVHEGSNLPELYVCFFAVFLAIQFIPLWRLKFLDDALYAFEGIVVLQVAASILPVLKIGWFHQILAWFGKHSLELYLTNIYLIQAMKFFDLQVSEGDLRGCWVYLVIVGLGILLSAVLAEMEKKEIPKIFKGEVSHANRKS